LIPLFLLSGLSFTLSIFNVREIYDFNAID
jgi:hypothetical protein